MRKIFLGLVFLVYLGNYSAADETEVYCVFPNSFLPYHVQKFSETHKQKAMFLCKDKWGVSIPKNIFYRLEMEDKNWMQKSHQPDPADSSWFIKKTLRENSDFMQKRANALEKIYNESINEINLLNLAMENQIKTTEKEKADNARIEAEKQKQLKSQLKTAELEKLYSDVCGRTNKKGSDKYNNCLLEKESADLALRKKSELEAKMVAEKISKMSPDDRRAYTCSEKFGFRKGSDKFKDCVFKIYQAEIEMEKLELQRELAKANAEIAKARAEAARASDDRQERLLQAQTEAAKMQSLAARQQAIAANTAESLALMESGLRMLSPQQPAPRMQTSCTYVGRFLNCF